MVMSQQMQQPVHGQQAQFRLGIRSRGSRLLQRDRDRDRDVPQVREPVRGQLEARTRDQVGSGEGEHVGRAVRVGETPVQSLDLQSGGEPTEDLLVCDPEVPQGPLQQGANGRPARLLALD